MLVSDCVLCVSLVFSVIIVCDLVFSLVVGVLVSVRICLM